MPSWAEIVIFNGGEFEKFASSSLEIISATPELQKFSSGFLLKEMFDRFDSKVQSTLSPDRSLWMYFAHDITIAAMLNSLGFDVVMDAFFKLLNDHIIYELFHFIDARASVRIVSSF